MEMVWIDAINTWNEIVNSDAAKWAFNRFMVTFFSKSYKKYLTNKLVIEWMAKIDAERQITEYSENPNSLISFMQSELEIDYKNMFWTLAKALPKIVSWIPDENEIDLDVMKRLKDLSKDFSSDDMQEIVSWILAWEYNKPWSFCLKTLDVVKNLTKNDIMLFQRFCWIVFDGKYFFRDSFNKGSVDILSLNTQWISYDDYLYLQDIWLVWDHNTWVTIWDPWMNVFSFSLQGNEFRFQKEWSVEITWLSSLTKAWEELLTISWFVESKILFDIVKAKLDKIFESNHNTK